ncbi:MAG: cytochrome c maturation protein CcmE [Legionella sp.]|uniref:cytochrome c maturation protein CcmE n=1 Tax=Legionella sp. TaxID=459 RepID=UPI0039E3A00B
MNPIRKRKLLILVSACVVFAVASGLVLYALRQNISLFYTPTQIAAGEAPLQRDIRVGGMVDKGSFIRAKEGLAVEFKITDFKQKITVNHRGILPDLFREGQGVVVEGQLVDNQHLQATRVLAKHDENYMPPEVKAALANKVNS